MTEREWKVAIAAITANWPHSLPPQESLEKWYGDVADLDGQQVAVAIEALYRDGREFPPNGAQIRAKADELHRSDPDHGKAWKLAMEAVHRFGSYDEEGAIAWLEAESPAVAEAVRRYGFKELCWFNLADRSIVFAQFRDVFRAACDERRRSDALAGLPESAVAKLGRRDGKPRRIGEAVAEIARGGA